MADEAAVYSNSIVLHTRLELALLATTLYETLTSIDPPYPLDTAQSFWIEENPPEIMVLDSCTKFLFCLQIIGRCGAKEEPFEKRGDKCQRVILGLFLGLLLLLVA